jgi:hypothetical protein
MTDPPRQADGRPMTRIYDSDHPLVRTGVYDEYGFKPGERARIEKQRAHAAKLAAQEALRTTNATGAAPVPLGDSGDSGDSRAINKTLICLNRKDTTMRLFDLDRVGCYLDAVGLRLEKTKDNETKVIDLTLRVQPFTPELAAALHPDVRALLFTMTEATPKPLLKGVELKLPNLEKQHLDVYLLPEDGQAQITLLHAEITDPRVRTEKGVDGYALVFYATIGPVGRDELEYVTNWYTQQRFLTFREAQAVMDFAGKPEGETEQASPRRRGRATAEAQA